MVRRRRGRPSPRERGFALLITLFVATFTLAAGALTASALVLRMELLRQQERDLRLTALVDAAMARSLAELARDPGWSGTGGIVPWSGGTFRVQASWVHSNQIDVEIQVAYGGMGRGAQAVVEILPVLRTLHFVIVPYLPYEDED